MQSRWFPVIPLHEWFGELGRVFPHPDQPASWIGNKSQSSRNVIIQGWWVILGRGHQEGCHCWEVAQRDLQSLAYIINECVCKSTNLENKHQRIPIISSNFDGLPFLSSHDRCWRSLRCLRRLKRFIIYSFVYFVRPKKVCLCSIHHYSK